MAEENVTVFLQKNILIRFVEVHKAAVTNGRIYGGRNAEDGEFPFHVSIWYFYVRNFEHTCGGSILSERKVLSSGYCITGTPGSGIGRYTVYAGLTSFDKTEFQQAVPVSFYVVHPDYPGGVAANDLVIVSSIN